ALSPVRRLSTEVQVAALHTQSRSVFILEPQATRRPPRPQVQPTPRSPRRSPRFQGRACPPAADTPRRDGTASRRTPPGSERPEPKRRVPPDASDSTGGCPSGTDARGPRLRR